MSEQANEKPADKRPARRPATRRAKTLVSHLLALDLLLVMATPMELEVVHEYAGIAMLVLVVVHVWFNRRWFSSLCRGCRSVRGVFFTVVDCGLMVCVAGIAVSSVVISRYALGFLPAIPGASWARSVHLLCSGWLFVLAFVHAGLHIPVRQQGLFGRLPAVLRSILATVCIALGAWAFFLLDMPAYLTLRLQFGFAQGMPAAQAMGLLALAALGLTSLGHALGLAMPCRSA